MRETLRLLFITADITRFGMLRTSKVEEEVVITL